MKIHFCALCNESVPQAALDSGAARVVKDRVICTTCEAAMSHADAGGRGSVPHPQRAAFEAGPHGNVPPPHAHAAVSVAPSAHVPPPAHVGPPAQVSPPASKPAAGSNTGLAWVAGLAIGFTALSIFVTDDRLARMGREQAQLQNQLDEKDDALHGLAAEFAKVHPALASVDQRLSQRLDAEREQVARLEASIGSVRTDFTQFTARIDGLTSEVEALRAKMNEPGLGIALEKRLGELSSRIAKAEDDRRALADQIAAIDVQAAAAPMVVAAGDPAAGDKQPSAEFTKSVADLSSPDETVRWDAVTSLGATKNPAVVPHLLPMLTDPTWLVRMAAARVLGEMHVREAVTPLIAMLEDEDSAARETAWINLRLITGKDLKFDTFASEAERAKRVKAWSDWWKKEGDGDTAKPAGGPEKGP